MNTIIMKNLLDSFNTEVGKRKNALQKQRADVRQTLHTKNIAGVSCKYIDNETTREVEEKLREITAFEKTRQKLATAIKFEKDLKYLGILPYEALLKVAEEAKLYTLLINNHDGKVRANQFEVRDAIKDNAKAFKYMTSEKIIKFCIFNVIYSALIWVFCSMFFALYLTITETILYSLIFGTIAALLRQVYRTEKIKKAYERFYNHVEQLTNNKHLLWPRYSNARHIELSTEQKREIEKYNTEYYEISMSGIQSVNITLPPAPAMVQQNLIAWEKKISKILGIQYYQQLVVAHSDAIQISGAEVRYVEDFDPIPCFWVNVDKMNLVIILDQYGDVPEEIQFLLSEGMKKYVDGFIPLTDKLREYMEPSQLN